jgi:hypothetical protein
MEQVTVWLRDEKTTPKIGKQKLVISLPYDSSPECWMIKLSNTYALRTAHYCNANEKHATHVLCCVYPHKDCRFPIKLLDACKRNASCSATSFFSIIVAFNQYVFIVVTNKYLSR